MSRKRLNLLGEKFGRLTVIAEAEDYVSPAGKRVAKLLCLCECENTTIVNAGNLRNGSTQSCGCYLKERNIQIHTLIQTKEYRAWIAIKTRCLNPNVKEYAYYGARGITICLKWIDDFLQFLADVGYAPSDKHSIDRIDNDKGYEPSNVRWTTKTVQGINRRTPKNNTSGVKGVCKKRNKWQAYISINKKNTSLGYFDSKKKAVEARKNAEEKYYKPLTAKPKYSHSELIECAFILKECEDFDYS